MPVEAKWYQEHIAGPVSENQESIRVRRELGDKSSQAAFTMAQEFQLLSEVGSEHIPFNTTMGMMQVTSLAVGTVMVENGGDKEMFPLAEDDVNDLLVAFTRIAQDTHFSPSGDAVVDMRRARVIIGSQTIGYDRESTGYREYEDGVNLGLMRWAALAS